MEEGRMSWGGQWEQQSRTEKLWKKIPNLSDAVLDLKNEKTTCWDIIQKRLPRIGITYKFILMMFEIENCSK